MVLEARRGFAALKQRASSAPAKRARAPTPPVDVDVLASEEVWTPSGSAVTSNEDEQGGRRGGAVMAVAERAWAVAAAV